MEVLNDLLGYNLKIYQDRDYFCYTLDSILLANFVKFKYTTKKVLDLGSGTGAISFIMSLRTDKNIDSIEKQKEVYDLCNKSIKYNNLENRINLINDDVNNFYKDKNNYYDIIVSNPPYLKEIKNNNVRANSKHENTLQLDNLIKVSKAMLKNNGSLYLVYTSERVNEVLNKVTANNLIPKRIKFVYDNLDTNSSIFLLECTKNGKEGMEIETPMILKNNQKNTKIYDKILSGGFMYEPEELSK